jgi:hypothetical protein
MPDGMNTHRRVVVTNTSGPVDRERDRPVSASVPVDALALQLIQRNRAVPRTKELLEAIARLDTEPNALAVQQIMEWIRAQYKERAGGQLLGLFSRCYLGPPFVDHAMTLTGYICEHYGPRDDVPLAYGAARALAANQAYEYVEVYSDGSVVPVRPNGKSVN